MSIRGPLGATPESGAFELNRRPRETQSMSSRVRLGQLGLLGLVVTGLLISIAAAHTDAILPESVRPIPSWLAGPFGVTGFGLGVGALLAVLAVMFVCYSIAVQTADRMSARAVLMTIAALHALVLLAPPLLSTDVFSYQAYARMGSLYGANPYLHGPHSIALDSVYPFIGWRWVTMPSAYGPLFTAFSYLLAPLSIAASVLAYKALAAIASLVLVALVWNAARLRGLDPVKAAALVGLNPLVVIYGVGGGHNDLLMLAALMAGVYLLLAHRERAGAGAIVIAAAVKLTAGVFLPFALAGAGGPRTRPRRRDVVVGASVLAACVATFGLIMFGPGVTRMFATVHDAQSRGDWHSIPGSIAAAFGTNAGQITGICLGVVFAAVFAFLLYRVWRGRLDWIDGAGWAAVALLLTASSLLPWYVAWLVPFGALASDRRLWRTTVIVTGVVMAVQMLGYIPHSA